ncbi:Na(+)/H(+) exchange regulatory cofactor NHE-RF2 [Liparis tanakae]|uniref:Na(+)/H(+) exchange regulatory cofactor NHE-RF2 n=1 Tax=Liparis tanakae TaxID=230148 RepID=A0A4Z2IRI0_9TELE|nr:Na(+)/H(+) exchange regulatory cofactor NHE-RF2 [Liparis tanakae]
MPSSPVPQVVQRIKALDDETRLLVVDQETHEGLRSLRLTATQEMAVLTVGHPSSSSSTSSPPPASPTPPPSSVPSSPSKKRENGSVSKQPVTLRGQVQKPTRRSPSKAAKTEAPSQAEAQAQPEPRPPAAPSELTPRLCHLLRSDAGYGFNLHSDRSRPGQYIRSLDPGSTADHAGLRPQDRLIEVNGVSIEGMRHAEVVAFIKKGGDETWLLVVDPETDEQFKRRGIVPAVSHIRDYDGPSISNGSPNPQINGSSFRFECHPCESARAAWAAAVPARREKPETDKEGETERDGRGRGGVGSPWQRELMGSAGVFYPAGWVVSWLVHRLVGWLDGGMDGGMKGWMTVCVSKKGKPPRGTGRGERYWEEVEADKR